MISHWQRLIEQLDLLLRPCNSHYHIVAHGYNCRTPVFANFTGDEKNFSQIFKFQTIFIILCHCMRNDIMTFYVSWWKPFSFFCSGINFISIMWYTILTSWEAPLSRPVLVQLSYDVYDCFILNIYVLIICDSCSVFNNKLYIQAIVQRK